MTTRPYGKFADSALHTTVPRKVPNEAPTAARTHASSRNCTRISKSDAPIALRRPISYRRSENEMSMTDRTPTPPTSSTVAARLVSTTLQPRIWSMKFFHARADSASRSTILTSSMPWCACLVRPSIVAETSKLSRFFTSLTATFESL